MSQSPGIDRLKSRTAISGQRRASRPPSATPSSADDDAARAAGRRCVMVVCAQCGREPRADESVIFLSFEARLLHVTCYEAESAKVIAHAHDVVNEATLRNKSSRELLGATRGWTCSAA